MKKISSDSISEWQTAEEREIAKQIQNGRVAIITWLGLARKPSGQVIDRLRKQGFEENIIQLIVASLQEDGYLNDETIALRTVRQRQGNRAESRRALNQRMQRMGLPDSVIRSALPDPETDYHAACQLIEGRFAKQLQQTTSMDCHDENGRVNRAARMAMWRKAGRFLAGRGFNQTTIIQVLHKYFPGIDSLDDYQA